MVNGYTAKLETTGGITDPQDEGEALFTVQWLTVEDALVFVTESIKEAKRKPMNDDANQGRLYNLMTTLELLTNLE